VPIDLDKVLGAELPGAVATWDADDVILYHLGVGAGVPPTDDNELEYTYEARLKVLPSFGVLPVFGALAGLVGLEGLSFNPMMLLHGEQEIELSGPIPTQAKVDNTAKVSGVYDKGKGALVVVEAQTNDESGRPLFVNRFAAFLRGEGGFGGEPGPAPGNEPPARDPDHVVESPTLPQQALLYRLSGDKNPLHIDPSFAQLGGFDKPILHGLCSYGIVCKAVVDTALGGDVGAVAGYRARFSGVVFPGETIVTSMWEEGGRIVVSARSKERDTPVISNAAITLRA
jgi:acyl dehydratase